MLKYYNPEQNACACLFEILTIATEHFVHLLNDEVADRLLGGRVARRQLVLACETCDNGYKIMKQERNP